MIETGIERLLVKESAKQQKVITEQKAKIETLKETIDKKDEFIRTL